MSSRKSTSRTKRRGHVQQYNTGNALPDPAVPPIAQGSVPPPNMTPELNTSVQSAPPMGSQSARANLPTSDRAVSSSISPQEYGMATNVSGVTNTGLIGHSTPKGYSAHPLVGLGVSVGESSLPELWSNQNSVVASPNKPVSAPGVPEAGQADWDDNWGDEGDWAAEDNSKSRQNKPEIVQQQPESTWNEESWTSQNTAPTGQASPAWNQKDGWNDQDDWADDWENGRAGEPINQQHEHDNEQVQEPEDQKMNQDYGLGDLGANEASKTHEHQDHYHQEVGHGHEHERQYEHEHMYEHGHGHEHGHRHAHEHGYAYEHEHEHRLVHEQEQEHEYEHEHEHKLRHELEHEHELGHQQEHEHELGHELEHEHHHQNVVHEHELRHQQEHEHELGHQQEHEHELGHELEHEHHHQNVVHEHELRHQQEHEHQLGYEQEHEKEQYVIKDEPVHSKEETNLHLYEPRHNQSTGYEYGTNNYGEQGYQNDSEHEHAHIEAEHVNAGSEHEQIETYNEQSDNHVDPPHIGQERTIQEHRGQYQEQAQQFQSEYPERDERGHPEVVEQQAHKGDQEQPIQEEHTEYAHPWGASLHQEYQHGEWNQPDNNEHHSLEEKSFGISDQQDAGESWLDSTNNEPTQQDSLNQDMEGDFLRDESLVAKPEEEQRNYSGQSDMPWIEKEKQTMPEKEEQTALSQKELCTEESKADEPVKSDQADILPWLSMARDDLVVYLGKKTQPEEEATEVVPGLKQAALNLLDMDDDLLLDDDFLDDGDDLLESYLIDDQAQHQIIDQWNEQASMHQVLPEMEYQPVEAKPHPAQPVSSQPALPPQPAHTQPAQPFRPLQPAQPAQHLQPAKFVQSSIKPKLTSTNASKYTKTADVPIRNVSTILLQAPYALSSAFNTIPVAKKADDELKKKLDEAKKKNDAYDFPIGLPQPPAKHASRVGSRQVHSHASTESFAHSEVPKDVPQSATSSNRSFFEELPDTVPRPSHRPVRAAAAAIPVLNHVQTPPLPSHAPPVSIKKSPKNPYAQLAPKTSNSPMFNKPLMGNVAPLVNAPMGNAPVPPGNSLYPPSKYQPPTAPPLSHPPLGMGQNIGQGYPMGQNAPPMGQNMGQGYPMASPTRLVPPPGVMSSPGIVGPGNFQNQGPQPGFQGNVPAGFQGNVQSMHAQGHGTQGLAPPHSHIQSANQGFPPVQQTVPFPSMQNLMKIDHPKSPRVNTNVAKSIEKNSTVSPYVPNSGPYAPSANRGHSRTNSILGGRGKEGNPYAPAQAGAPPIHQGLSNTGLLKSPVVRNRVKSLGKLNSLKMGRPLDPAALLMRQFPIFSWGNGDMVAYLVPEIPTSGFQPPARTIKIKKSSEALPKLAIYGEFPGPLSKSKSKKKEVETWLEKNISLLLHSYSDELLLSQVLLALVQQDGQFSLPALHKQLASVLTPNVDFSQEQNIAPNYINMGSHGLSANAYKLDSAGINTVWSLIQTGNREGALEFAISKQDWALSFIVAHSISPERFSKVASDYARMMFPFQRNQNTKIHHLMPILMKTFVGNPKGPIEDFVNVSSEAEFAKTNFREILSAAIINGCSSEFLVEYGKFLMDNKQTLASELCFMIAGFPLSLTPLLNGAVFTTVGSFTVTAIYAEVYEYVLSLSPVTSNIIPQTGLPHLIPYKVTTAQLLADLGAFGSARKYCDHLSSILKMLGRSPLVGPQVYIDFQNLLMRISESNANDSGWLGSKLSRVNLDKVWGHLDKFIGGEDFTPKTDTGVFSKFSPALSRNASALDISQIPNSLPQQRPDLLHQASYMSATPNEFPSPSHLVGRVNPPRYTHGIANPNQPLKVNAPVHGPGHVHGSAPAYGPVHGSNIYGSAGNGMIRQTHGNGSQLSLVDETRAAKPPKGKVSVSSKNTFYGNRTGHLSNLSLTSLTSVQRPLAPPAVQKSVSTDGSRSSDHGRGNGEELQSKPASKDPSRISSLQSDISMSSGELKKQQMPEHNKQFLERISSVPLPQEPESKVLLPEPVAEPVNEPASEPVIGPASEPVTGPASEPVTGPASELVSEPASEPATESVAKPDVVPEIKTETTEISLVPDVVVENKPELVSNVAGKESDKEQAPEKSEDSDTQNKPEGEPMNISEPLVPPSKGGPRRANPYAPGASKSVGQKKNRYGPPGRTSNKYASPNSHSAFTGVPEVTDIDMFGFSRDQNPVEEAKTEDVIEELQQNIDIQQDAQQGKEPETEQKPKEETEQETDHVRESEKEQAEESEQNGENATEERKKQTLPVHPEPAADRKMAAPPKRNYAPKKTNPYAPTQKLNHANVDISFEDTNDDVVETPVARKSFPLVLNTQSSPILPDKDKFVNPFQDDEKEALRLQNGLDEFPIPGSPEYTTRANSVIGQQGLYSSRLSQSHQTDMYQQYEVKDDTVMDYIPVEEDEEDEEEAQARLAAKRKKLEEIKKNKETEELVSRSGQTSRDNHQSTASSNKWFLGLLKLLNDDKPKPIKAKLGQKNTFKYDEKLQRWIDTSRPLEEQLQDAAPPPPPKKKIISKPEGVKTSIPAPNTGTDETQSVPSIPSIPSVPSAASAPGAPSAPGAQSSPSAPGGPRAPARKTKPRPKAAADLANAGLDDLLSLTGSNMAAGPRKSKRKYVNVMDKK